MGAMILFSFCGNNRRTTGFEEGAGPTDARREDGRVLSPSAGDFFRGERLLANGENGSYRKWDRIWQEAVESLAEIAGWV